MERINELTGNGERADKPVLTDEEHNMLMDRLHGQPYWVSRRYKERDYFLDGGFPPDPDEKVLWVVAWRDGEGESGDILGRRRS